MSSEANTNTRELILENIIKDLNWNKVVRMI